MPRIEHVQMLHPDDRSESKAAGIAASVQPVHLGSDAAQARKLWGDRAEATAYTWKSIADTGAVMAFGTDAPGRVVRPLAGPSARRAPRGRTLASGHPDLRRGAVPHPGPSDRAALLDPRRLARETDRGRLPSASEPTSWSSRLRRSTSPWRPAAAVDRAPHGWSCSTARSS